VSSGVLPKSTYFDGYKLDEQQLLTKLLEFIGSKIIVVHDGGLEIHLLNHGCDLFNIDRVSNTVIDTRKLAQLVYPDSPYYELDYLLRQECKVPVPLDHSYKVALLFVNLQEEAKEKKINICKAAIFSDDTIAV
jgi:DNA polymerase III alpha subunit (gram-positive type)